MHQTTTPIAITAQIAITYSPYQLPQSNANSHRAVYVSTERASKWIQVGIVQYGNSKPILYVEYGNSGGDLLEVGLAEPHKLYTVSIREDSSEISGGVGRWFRAYIDDKLVGQEFFIKKKKALVSAIETYNWVGENPYGLYLKQVIPADE